jgi:predicted molibdopterin-dependent oxidoreductase YjgC
VRRFGMGRVLHHPILSEEEVRRITFYFEGRELEATEGETVAAALLANGIKSLRYTSRQHETRGIFCGIGQCSDCMMEVDGKLNVRTCVTPVRQGMKVKMQSGFGVWRRED